jgi:Spy/CpxP family protein refolding chaperone
MRTRILMIGAASIVALAMVATVAAQRPGVSGRGGPGRGPAAGNGQVAPGPRAGGPGAGGFLVRGLDLTDDQQEVVADIARGTRDDIAPVTDALQLARRTLHREAFADQRDAARVDELVDEITALEKQVLTLRVQSQSAISAVLTAEQREAVRARGVGPFNAGRRGGPPRGRPRQDPS